MNESRALLLCTKYKDPLGFEFLVRKYEREAFMHAAALLGNREDAADACQECFGKAFASISRLTSLDAFYPWFYRILRNHCLNALSRRKTAADYARAERLSGTRLAEGADEIVGKKEEAAKVWRALESLKPEFREILALKFIRGHDYATLSALIGIPRGTVMSRLYHARKAFQAAYSRQGQGLEDENGEEHVQL
jgi:RNA polymerase sigma-70 factor (ECF subfamily)